MRPPVAHAAQDMDQVIDDRALALGTILGMDDELFRLVGRHEGKRRRYTKE